MNRLLTKRDKNGSHRRSKSSEPGNNKVTSSPRPLSLSLQSSNTKSNSIRSSVSSAVASISAAFPSPNGKSSAQIKPTIFQQHATSTDIGFRFVLQSRPLSGSGILSLLRPAGKKQKESDAKKIQILKQRLRDQNITGIGESQIEYALETKYADGDPNRAFEMLVLFQESVEGIVRQYNPDVHMLGAENRGAVTCYLDSLLFAMFARLGSFEPILYTQFDDEPRRRLSTLIRLWVNMLRSGKLIQTDITEHLQEALAACGWEEAAELRQQDTSEAFGFITEKLQLPLITMEMDLFHEGKAGDPDDHKLINERLLEVAIPQEHREGRPIRLEDCLEEYFNTRVEVVRRLDRRNTLQLGNVQAAAMSNLPTVDEKDGGAEHIEHVESPTIVNEQGDSATPSVEPADLDGSRSMTPVQSSDSAPSPRPTIRRRATSIIRHVVVPEAEAGEASSNGDNTSIRSSIRKGSIRKEVMMPAWQFFRIIRSPPIYSHFTFFTADRHVDNLVLIGNTAWYTAQIPINDAQVAAHFSSTRPVLGICLKRYAISREGLPIRQNTAVDIPLQIALPHFIRDDKASDDGPLFGNFNLVLQSVVCHRGTSVHAGHYIAFIRGTAKPRNEDHETQRRNSSDSELPEYSEDRWIKFDDLVPERVTYVDIEKALSEEMPYLLFYQVQPICPDEPYDDPALKPPSYQDSAIGMTVQEATPIRTTQPDPFPPSRANSSYFESESMSAEEHKPRMSFSDDAELPRQSLNLPDSSRRGSLAWTDTSTSSIPSAPVTPNEEVSSSRLSRAASRFGRREKSKSRPSSHADENRISMTLSKFGLTGGRNSKELSRSSTSSAADVLSTVAGAAESYSNQRKDEVKASAEADEKRVADMNAQTAVPEKIEPQPLIQPSHHPPSPYPPEGTLKGKKKGKGKSSVRGSKQSQDTQDRECVLM